jgi:hypothetical protein
MKKVIIAILIAVTFTACGSGESTNTTETTVDSTKVDSVKVDTVKAAADTTK